MGKEAAVTTFAIEIGAIFATIIFNISVPVDIFFLSLTYTISSVETRHPKASYQKEHCSQYPRERKECRGANQGSRWLGGERLWTNMYIGETTEWGTTIVCNTCMLSYSVPLRIMLKGLSLGVPEAHCSSYHSSSTWLIKKGDQDASICILDYLYCRANYKSIEVK